MSKSRLMTIAITLAIVAIAHRVKPAKKLLTGSSV